MFGGLLRIRLRAAEQALKDGRLDTAMRMAVQPEIAGNARGQKLLANLGKAFLDRARAHYRADRFTEALLDLGRADSCGGVLPQVEALRKQVLTVAGEVARQQADKRGRIEAARRRMYDGSLAGGGEIIAGLDAKSTAVQAVDNELAARKSRLEALIDRAQKLLDLDQPAAAVSCITEARRISASDERVLALESQICDRIIRQARDAFESGRLQQARTALDSLGGLGGQTAAFSELDESLHLANSACSAVAAARFDDAQRSMGRLERLCPKTAWVRLAASQIVKINEKLLEVRTGPLGTQISIAMGQNPAAITQTMQDAGFDETMTVAPRRAVGGDPLPPQLLVLVDGGGSYLLLRGQRAGIGRAAGDNPADIPILSDLSERHAEIVRVEDDYFLFCPNEAEVAGRRAQQQLLRDGDRVVLSRRAKFTFRMPNRKSASGRIDMSDSTRMPRDVRRVILFRRNAMIGRGNGCHVQCPTSLRDLVLFEREGGLWLRPQGRGAGQATHIELGRTIEVDGVSFVVAPWSNLPTGGAATA